MFELDESSISNIECIIFIWVVAMFIDEIRQIARTPVKNLGDSTIKTIQEFFGRIQNYMRGE